MSISYFNTTISWSPHKILCKSCTFKKSAAAIGRHAILKTLEIEKAVLYEIEHNFDKYMQNCTSCKD